MTGSSRAQWIVAAVIVPVPIAVLTSPFWLEKIFGSTDTDGDHNLHSISPTNSVPPSQTGSGNETPRVPSSTPADDPATIYLSTDSGSVGATVLVSGTGFGADETVEINVGTIDCARTTIGQDGKFSQVACVIPDWYASFHDGELSLNATGRTTLKYDQRSFHLT